MNEIQIVRKILAFHQQAYAQAHCVEKRGVIESDNIAIGYASVELANILAAPGRNGALAGDGAAPLVGPQTNLENFSALREQLNLICERQAAQSELLSTCVSNLVAYNQRMVEIENNLGRVENRMCQHFDALALGQESLGRAVAKRAARGAGAKKGKRRP